MVSAGALARPHPTHPTHPTLPLFPAEIKYAWEEWTKRVHPPHPEVRTLQPPPCLRSLLLLLPPPPPLVLAVLAASRTPTYPPTHPDLPQPTWGLTPPLPPEGQVGAP